MILFVGIILPHSADLNEFAVRKEEPTMRHTRGVPWRVGDLPVPPSEIVHSH